MKLIKKEFVCPYCFSKHDLYNILFRCQNNPTKCPQVVDNELGAFLGKTSLMNKVFSIPKPSTKTEHLKSILIPKELRCPHCNELSHERICPSCHNALPHTIGDYKDMIFALIGAKEAGKSHYISVLIDMIKNHVCKSFSANLQPMNDNTIKKYRENFYTPVFKKREVIPETISARADYSVKMPLVYHLSFSQKNWLRKEVISKVCTITFFDTAGEDLNAEDTMRTENKYIYNSQGIILLVDPLQLPEVRNILASKGIYLPNENAEADDVVSRVVTLIRSATRNWNAKIDIPIAVAFSKIDALEDYMDKSLFLSGDHNGYYNASDANNISTLIESFLEEWAGAAIINAVKTHFSTYSFFGVSALGSNPGVDKKIPKLMPIRVEDPFLWLLNKNNIIKDKPS